MNVHTLTELSSPMDGVVWGNDGQMRGVVLGGGESNRPVPDINVHSVSGTMPHGRTMNEGHSTFCVMEDKDVLNSEDMKRQMDGIEQDYDAVDKSQYTMDEQTAIQLKDEDERLVMKTSRTKMDREIGMQMKKIDAIKNDEMRVVQNEIMNYKALIKQNERKLDDIRRNADMKKAVLRRRRIQLKFHPM